MMLMLIISTISKAAFLHVQGTTTSRKVWLSLERAYAPHTSSREYTLKNQLLKLEMKGDETSDAYLNRAKEYPDALANIGEAFKEKDLIMLLIAGLCDDYNGLKSTLLARQAPTAFHELQRLLADHDYMIKQYVPVIPSQTGSSPWVFTTTTFGTSSQTGSSQQDPVQAVTQLASQLGFNLQPLTQQAQAFNTSYPKIAVGVNTVYGTCNRCCIGHIPSDFPNRDPTTFRNRQQLSANHADYRSQSPAWIFDTGSNGHVAPDSSSIGTSEPYYGEDFLHVSNGRALGTTLLTGPCKHGLYSINLPSSQPVPRSIGVENSKIVPISFLHLASFVERRHRHVVEIGLTLHAQSGVPSHFWHFAYDTAVYLINSIPSHHGYMCLNPTSDRMYIARHFRRRPPAKVVSLCVADSLTGNHLEDDFTPLKTIQRSHSIIGKRIPFKLEWENFKSERRVRKRIIIFLFTMSAKDSIAIQTCKLSEEEFNEFLALYSIPSLSYVILPKSKQTVLDAPPGYVGLYTYSFFSLIIEMAFRNFVYAADEEDLSFLPKEPSPAFGTGSPSVSVNIEPLMTDKEPVLQPTEATTDSGGSLKRELFVVHPRSVADRRKCKTRGGSSRPLVKRRLTPGSLTARATRAKCDNRDLSRESSLQKVWPRKKNQKYEWAKEQEEAFQALKDNLCNAPILSLPDGPEDFVVYCNASNQGLGCVLMQRGKSSVKDKILAAPCEASKVENATAEMLRGLDQLMERKEDGGMYVIWVPLIGDVRTLIMDEAHASRYLVHSGADNTYYDLRDMYGGHERISKKRMKNKAKTTKPDTEWKSWKNERGKDIVKS
ncbi:putative RNA-directed DNA polymerase [Tanacetum coccineum]